MTKLKQLFVAFLMSCATLVVNAAPLPAAQDTGMSIVASARQQVGKTLYYDPSYTRIPYPMGDVPMEIGVCTDVIIRALRDALKMDLQQLVHRDMTAAFSEYPKNWGLKKPDSNIDHRRVLNLQKYFSRKGFSLKITEEPENYLPGDIVSCTLPGNLPHIMIVSDKKVDGIPLIIHNIGGGAKEEEGLFFCDITGHYRIKPLPNSG
ncbi:MAG: DUF1287 domain-containing protein [Candidatus Fibromonas sp.]|jgi:uncharacterized protein YijF (DUF1287 family)|nr:DUF1287 domain-containing protein [Candidatus Fibromonas sp.]